MVDKRLLPTQKPGEDRLTDIIVHDFAPIGGDVEDQIFELLKRFPESEMVLRSYINSVQFSDASEAINKQRALVRDGVVDIWNAYMRDSLSRKEQQ